MQPTPKQRANIIWITTKWNQNKRDATIPSTFVLLFNLHWQKSAIKYKNRFNAIMPQQVYSMHTIVNVPKMGMKCKRIIYNRKSTYIINRTKLQRSLEIINYFSFESYFLKLVLWIHKITDYKENAGSFLSVNFIGPK